MLRRTAADRTGDDRPSHELASTSITGMRVILAQPRGFFAGVIRAIDIVEQALQLFGARVYLRHEIVHNRHVAGTLRAKGARMAGTLSAMPRTSRPGLYATRI